MENEEHKKEYVLADSGLIWRGSHTRMRPSAWNFAQFEKDILECSVWLLSNVGKLTIAGRAGKFLHISDNPSGLELTATFIVTTWHLRSCSSGSSHFRCGNFTSFKCLLLRNLIQANQQVNSPDDLGVLEGNWSNNYSGGTAPTKWQGSMLILQQFWKTKKPVKFGQCWVFSGVVTTGKSLLTLLSMDSKVKQAVG